MANSLYDMFLLKLKQQQQQQQQQQHFTCISWLVVGLRRNYSWLNHVKSSFLMHEIQVIPNCSLWKPHFSWLNSKVWSKFCHILPDSHLDGRRWIWSSHLSEVGGGNFGTNVTTWRPGNYGSWGYHKNNSPHLCVGFLFLVLHSRLPPPASTHDLLTHNLSTHHLLTHNLSTHNLLTHNLLTHNLLTHNLSTHNWLTYNLLTHNLLTHAQLVHTYHTYIHTIPHHTTPYHTIPTHNIPYHTIP